jgi:hypothetical protein
MAEKRKRKRKEHGTGWNALAACVLVFAVRDAVKSRQPKVRAEARAFLESTACDELLDFLGLPSNQILLNAIDNGLSTELVDQMGSFTSNQVPDASAARVARHRERKRAATSVTLSTQPLLLVW